MTRRAIASAPAWCLPLLVLALVLQISGLELALHEAAEKDCTDGVDGVCLQCIALTTAPASAETGVATLPEPAPLYIPCVEAGSDPTPSYGAGPVPGRSPPTGLPA